jgi:hypothetical protein
VRWYARRHEGQSQKLLRGMTPRTPEQRKLRVSVTRITRVPVLRIREENDEAALDERERQ